jgi:hypothetical protein
MFGMFSNPRALTIKSAAIPDIMGEPTLVYQLHVALPQQKLYDLFKQKTIDIDADDKPVVPRFNEVVIGIAPNGLIMLWASVGGGYDEVELMGPVTAINIDGLTVAMYNQSVRESFWLYERWDHLSDYLDQINAEGLKTRHDNDGGMVVTGVFET